jgi:hypothetical protein
MTNPNEEEQSPIHEVAKHFGWLKDSMEEMRSRCRTLKEAAQAERLRLSSQREAMAKLRLTLAGQWERLEEGRKAVRRPVEGDSHKA